MPELSYNDKKALLASSLKVNTYDIRDFTDDTVIYYDSQTSKLYGRKYAAKDGKLVFEVAQAYMARTTYEPVTSLGTFSLDEDVEFAGDEVLLTGKVFEAGDYPDKQFSLTEAEMAQAVADFAPVDNDLEHKKTILSGKIGQLRNIVAKGKELFGTVAIPKWLYEANDRKPVSASLTWNRANKRIVGNALVLNPRVSDAQLYAAFSAANPEGGTQMPVIIPGTKKPSWLENITAMFTANQLPEGLEDFDPAQVQFTDEPPVKPADKAPEPAKPAEDAAFSALQEEVQTLKAKNAGLDAKLLLTEAAAFADGVIKASKAFPAERDSLIAMFKQAAEDDNSGVACFSGDGTLNEGSRVKQLKAMMEARPAHRLMGEAISDTDVVLMSADSGTKKQTTDELLAATPMGRKAAARKKQEGR